MFLLTIGKGYTHAGVHFAKWTSPDIVDKNVLHFPLENRTPFILVAHLFV
jgi:hypothetical protein